MEAHQSGQAAADRRDAVRTHPSGIAGRPDLPRSRVPPTASPRWRRFARCDKRSGKRCAHFSRTSICRCCVIGAARSSNIAPPTANRSWSRVGPLGVRLAKPRRELRSDGNPLARLYLRMKQFRRSMRLDVPISLVHPLARREPGITVTELDCLVSQGVLKRSSCGDTREQCLEPRLFRPAPTSPRDRASARRICGKADALSFRETTISRTASRKTARYG